MKCQDCDQPLTRAIDRRRGLCARCYQDERRQVKLFETRETIEGKQRLLMEEAGTMFLR